MKSLLRGDEWIGIELAALNIDTYFTGGLCFGFPNRLENPVVLKLAQEFFCAHFVTNSSLRLHRLQFPRHREIR